MIKALFIRSLLLGSMIFQTAQAATIVPNEVQMPGTQPNEVSALQTPDRCDNCHGGYDPNVEPAHNWRGSMMAHAGRDPLFWATLAIAEQDFDGAGDLCIRCHSPGGWIAGRSVPTDGGSLSTSGDADGVECDLCHRLTNPNGSEHVGVQTAPFIANDGGNPTEGHYGSGQYVLWNGSDKLGPYNDASARHQFMQSQYHRSSELCGTCHDVSNPVTGDLAPNHGAQFPLAAGTYSGTLGTAIESKAAFNNRPYQYGVVERTFSEHQSSALAQMRVADYNSLPAELKQGSIKQAYDAALLAGRNGDYADGTPRFFTCQTCHMRPVVGQGCNKNPQVRSDLPLHDLTGGNTWIPEAIKYLDAQGKLMLGGGMSIASVQGLDAGVLRAQDNLQNAAALTVAGDTVRVVNLTGHKLISGYPEGRRMWLNIKWYNDQNELLREDGAFGNITANINGTDTQVNTLLDLSGSNTRIYEAHGSITQEWADKLINELGAPASLPVAFDRNTGNVAYTLGQVAAQAPGSYHETFHFVLNNHVVKDNRIPPYGMRYDEAAKRNALPVPANQFGNPGAGGVYNYWDELALNPPVGASYANISLMYQTTSWEYIQFLFESNNGSVTRLANTGQDLLEAWLNTGMSAPVIMASASWGTPPEPQIPAITSDNVSTWSVNRQNQLQSQTSNFRVGDTVAVVVHVRDAQNLAVSNASVIVEIRDPAGTTVSTITSNTDTSGNSQHNWKSGKRSTSGNYTVVVTSVTRDGNQYDAGNSVTSAIFTLQ